MEQSSIIRVEHDVDNPYIMVAKTTAQHRGLSFEARGVLLYLLSKPNDWKLIPADIQAEGDIGRDQCMRILKELEDAGYIVVERAIGKANHYTVKERPVGFSVTGNQSRETRPLLNKEEQSTDKQNTIAPSRNRDRSYMNIDLNRPAPEREPEPNEVLNSNLVKKVFSSFGLGGNTIGAKLQQELSRKVKVSEGNKTVVYDSPIDCYDRDANYREFVDRRVKQFQSLLHPPKRGDVLINLARFGKPAFSELGVKQWPGFHYWKMEHVVPEQDKPTVIDYGAPPDAL